MGSLLPFYIFMSKEINHTCIVCGTGYHACDTCNELKKINSWQRFTDTSNHYKIFQIINDYSHKVIDKKYAFNMLNKCDLKGYKNFYPNITKIIDEILEYKNTVLQQKEDNNSDKIVTYKKASKRQTKQ